MLWHATSPCTETSSCGRFKIVWHQAGFGIWVAVAHVAETMVPIGEFANSERDFAGDKARNACQAFAWGWVA